MSVIQRRILEHLGAASLLVVGACREPEVARSEPGASASPASMSANAAATASAEVPSATAGPSATAATSATTTAPAGGGDVGAVCKVAQDCKPGLHCRLGFDGATFSADGVCTTERPIYRGRPLVVDGAPRVAEVVGAEPEVGAWAAYFARAAAEEHASVAAFARTLCQLMALGAPLGLLERTQAALTDELDHTRGSLAWLARFGGAAGTEATLGPLPSAVAPLARATVDPMTLARELLVDVVRGGCVGEARAAEAMLARAEETTDPALASWLLRVADDEARHAALAFETTLWLVRRWPELAALVAAERERLDTATLHLVAPLFEATGLVARAAA